MNNTKKKLDELTYNIIGACIEVHKNLGPGLLESTYKHCLKIELQLRGLHFVAEHPIKVEYKNHLIGSLYRCDLIIEDLIILELKAVDALIPIYDAQVLTYMKLLEKPKGIIVNFNVNNIFHNGQKTLVNDLYAALKPM